MINVRYFTNKGLTSKAASNDLMIVYNMFVSNKVFYSNGLGIASGRPLVKLR